MGYLLFVYMRSPHPNKTLPLRLPYSADIYNMVYSLVLTNKIDSPREYFRVLYLQSGVPSDISK